MPRKSTKKTGPEAAAKTPEATEAQTPAVPAGESDLPAKKKAAPKKRAKKAEAASVVVQASEPAEAEMTAQAADTFEAAFEANDGHETKAAEPATEAPKKKARSRKTVKAAEPAPEPEPQPAEAGPDEEDELAGDWESGSSSDEEEEEREKKPQPPPHLERLQKILAAAGVASRRHAEELITEGRVQVNGQVVTALGTKADAARDHIRVDGKLLHGAERLRYFVLNKPRGYVTTVSDPEGRPTVMEFFSKMGERLYPVGRLDYLSEGLLLMTNDGELANKLTRAASGVEKTYLVKVSGQPDEEAIDALREGVRIDRGKPGEGRVRTAPAQIQQVRAGENPWFEVTLIEGRNRELRKMFEEIGHHVEKIRRVGYGPLVLDLEPGQMRELEADELSVLRLAADGKWKPKRMKTSAMLPKEAGRSVEHEADRRRGGKPFREKRGPEKRGGFGGRGEGGRGGERGQSRDRGGDRPYAGPGRERREERPFAGRDREQRPFSGGSREGQPERGGFQSPGGGRRFEGQGRTGGGRGGERGGFARPQGDRPFRGKPRFDRERPSREGRPPRTGGLHIEEDNRESRPREERGGAGGQRFGGRPARPAGGGFKPREERPARFGNEERREFRPREERPRAEGRGEQRFVGRPPRPAGGGFKPRPEGQRSEDRRGGARGFAPREGGERGGQGRGPARGPGRGFGERSERPRHEEGGEQRPGARGGFAGRERSGSGGRPKFGGGNRGGGGFGGRGGGRPGGRGGNGGPGRGRGR